MTQSQIRLLRDLAEINPRGTHLLSDQVVSFVGMADLDEALARNTSETPRLFEEVSKGYTPFQNGDLLAAKITPCWQNGKVGQAVLQSEHGMGSTEFHVVRPGPDADARYLLHFLRTPHVRDTGTLRMTGSGGQRRVPAKYVSDLAVPTPPLAEQRRIASILDEADAIRLRRHTQLTNLERLPADIFREMFSSVTRTRKARFLMSHIRNGVSPSTNGNHEHPVLTLSAITGGRFDPSSVKIASFASKPGHDKRISAQDFLICRGNGNKNLVGVGHSPTLTDNSIIFPDTIIAGRVREDIIDPSYLEAAWATTVVRRQIELAAHTTNGTFKINQTSVGDIDVPLADRSDQSKFADQVTAIRAERERVVKALEAEEELFTALQYRAFHGEL